MMVTKHLVPAERSQMAKKRTNGEGTIRQRDNGLWECTIMDGFQSDGRRKTKSFYGKTQGEVKKKLKAYLQAKETGELAAMDFSFSEWADLWYENHLDNIKPTTQENYRYTLRILKDGFSRRKVKDVKAYDIEQFLKKLRKEGRSDSCLAQCRGMLYQIFNKAEANDLINKNPVRFAEKMRKRPPQRKEAFTADEVKFLLKNLPENQIGWSIRLMLGTGMRTQELLALEPRHITEEGTFITIEQALVMEKGTSAIGTPKSYDSYRCVPVPENIRYCARLLRDTHNKFIWESVKKPGMPCNPSYFRDKFKQTLEDMEEVRVLTPHCCRHTYVSQMQALGVDLATIQSIVGHADVDMTKHYLHVQDPVRQAAIEKFAVAFSSRPVSSHLNLLDLLESS